MLFPQFIILCCFLPMNQSLVTAIHLQFALPTVFGPPKPPLPHGLPMQNSLYPVMNGTFGNVSRQFPIRSTTNSGPTLNLRDANKMCCSFVLSVQHFMPFECPVNVRRRANNGSAEFPKMKAQGLYVFLVNGTVPTCKACNR